MASNSMGTPRVAVAFELSRKPSGPFTPVSVREELERAAWESGVGMELEADVREESARDGEVVAWE